MWIHNRKTNQGFSLVELIVVIAIMAVLVGVFAPQYVKYVRRSKVAIDVGSAKNIATAIICALSDENMPLHVPEDGSMVKVKADELPDIDTYPVSKVDSSYEWDVQVGGNGLIYIKLGGYQIWPDPDDPTDGYRTKNQ